MNEEKNQVTEFKDSDSRYLEFNIGNESYAIGLLGVLEVTSVPKYTPIPNSPPHVLGVMNLRGKIVTIVDARMKLGIEPMEDNKEMAVIIVKAGESSVGLIVDSINKVLKIDDTEIEDVVEVKKHGNAKYIDGIYHKESQMTFLINPYKLLDVDHKYFQKAA